MKLLSKKEVGQRRVYDIEVESVHNFYANGVNVHNCATAGGVSVIKDDGTVVNRGTLNNQRRIEFLDDDRFWVNGVSGSQHADWIGRISTTAKFGLISASIPRLRNSSSPSSRQRVLEQSAQIAVASDRSTGRLTRISDAWDGFSDALWCEHASDHVTGWMTTGIKGAFLSDTDDTDLVGSGELVTNGTFDTDTTGWTAYNSATLSVVSGKLRTTNGVASSGGAGQAITTVVGQRYVLQVELTGINGFLHIGTSIGNTSILGRTLITDESVTVDFVAATTTTWVTVSNNNSTIGVFKEWDNVSVKLADADRSVNG